MKIIPILLLLLFSSVISHSQSTDLAHEQNIPVCCNVTEPDNEFSCLAKWKNYVLLIPQHRAMSDTHNIVAIDTLSIDSVLTHQVKAVSNFTTITFDTSLNTIINAIQQRIGRHKKYGGFEAAVAVGDSLFFTVETDSLCFIVKGIIKGEKGIYHVVFKPKEIMALQKPDYLFDNAGFESLTYLPNSNQLITFYENNNLKNGATGYNFNTNFSHKQALHFEKPLLFRLTDVTAATDTANNTTLLGINFFYNDFKKDTGRKATEFNYYLTGDTDKMYSSRQLSTAFAEMHGGNLLKDCFSRIVSLQLQGNTISWREEKLISYQCDNWEGITFYKKGVLLIVDGKPPGVNCRLSYFELDKAP